MQETGAFLAPIFLILSRRALSDYFLNRKYRFAEAGCPAQKAKWHSLLPTRSRSPCLPIPTAPWRRPTESDLDSHARDRQGQQWRGGRLEFPDLARIECFAIKTGLLLFATTMCCPKTRPRRHSSPPGVRSMSKPTHASGASNNRGWRGNGQIS